MKKLIITLSLILLLSCNSSRNSSINDLINKGDLETLKKKKKEYVDLMNDLRLDLNDINNGIMLLDENEQIQEAHKLAKKQIDSNDIDLAIKTIFSI